VPPSLGLHIGLLEVTVFDWHILQGEIHHHYPSATKLLLFGDYWHQSVKYYACQYGIFPVQIQ